MSLTRSSGLSRIAWTTMVLCLITLSACGCGHRSSVVEETHEYSYEDVAKQIAAEEADSQNEREK